MIREPVACWLSLARDWRAIETWHRIPAPFASRRYQAAEAERAETARRYAEECERDAIALSAA